jgi:hypothetical protein
MTLEEMRTREAIMFTAILYNANGDAGDYENHRNVFTADAEMSVQDSIFLRGIDEIVAGLRAGGEARHAFDEGNFQRHHLSTPVIELTAEDTARAQHYLIVTTELGFDHTGKYVDELVRRGERWLIRRRVAFMEWVRPDSRFARWLGNPAVPGSSAAGG